MEALAALEALGGDTMARDPDRRVSIAPPTRSFSDSTLRAAPAAPEQAPPATGSGRAAAQEAARRIREQS